MPTLSWVKKSMPLYDVGLDGLIRDLFRDGVVPRVIMANVLLGLGEQRRRGRFSRLSMRRVWRTSAERSDNTLTPLFESNVIFTGAKMCE